jgi:hypothetical protein
VFSWFLKICLFEFVNSCTAYASVSRRAYDYPASYVHDLIVTDNYYILFDCPIKIDFPAVFTKYIFEKSCLSELICEAGLYKLNSVVPQLSKAPGFNP